MTEPTYDSEQQPREVDSDEEDDGFLYHYTSLDAFTSIIRNRTLWASHIKYLNDTSEQEILKGLAVLKLLAPAESYASGAAGPLKSYFDGISLPTFIACFSADGGDRLSQWRAYGGNSGICLKFRKDRLFEWSDDLLNRVQLKQVIYVPPNGDGLTGAAIDTIIRDLNGGGGVMLNIHITAALFKHRAFAEEKEWRLITNPVDGIVKHRTRGSLLVPYVELSFGEDLTELLSAVIVGPTNHKEQTAEAIKEFLKTNGFTSTEVRISETPYRGF